MKFAIATVVAALAAASVNPSTAAAAEPPGQTRFGQLSVEYGGPLQLGDQPVKPEIRGNESLDILAVFRVGKVDVALLQDNGGSGCPAQFMFVTIDKKNVMAGPEFGTCATVVHFRQSRQAIVVSMPLLYGHGSRRYEFHDGVVTETGKALK